MMRFLNVARRAWAAYQRGVEGAHFAQALCDFEEDGEEMYEELAGLGKEGILAAVQSTPFWPQIERARPAFELWLDSFLSYGKQEGGAA